MQIKETLLEIMDRLAAIESKLDELYKQQKLNNHPLIRLIEEQHKPEHVTVPYNSAPPPVDPFPYCPCQPIGPVTYPPEELNPYPFGPSTADPSTFTIAPDTGNPLAPNTGDPPGGWFPTTCEDRAETVSIAPEDDVSYIAKENEWRSNEKRPHVDNYLYIGSNS
jgi:hypothetical protein